MILDTSSPNMAAKLIVGGRSHVDSNGFVDHGCCHFGAWGDVTRVIAKVIVGSRSHVDYASSAPGGT